MSGVVIVDASVLLNILNVHQFNQDRSAVVAQLDKFMNAEAHLLLPLTAIFQTGDHIADLRDGRQRRRYAKRLRETRPYKYSSFPRKRESVAAFPQEKAHRYCGRPRPDSRFRGNDEYYSMGIVLCNADTSEVRPPRWKPPALDHVKKPDVLQMLVIPAFECVKKSVGPHYDSWNAEEMVQQKTMAIR